MAHGAEKPPEPAGAESFRGRLESLPYRGFRLSFDAIKMNGAGGGDGGDVGTGAAGDVCAGGGCV